MKFLLTAGRDYHPLPGSEDWIGFFDSRAKAQSKVKLLTEEWRKKHHKVQRYAIDLGNGSKKYVDWYRIINIESWHAHDEFECFSKFT